MRINETGITRQINKTGISSKIKTVPSYTFFNPRINETGITRQINTNKQDMENKRDRHN